jgi:hypothetical protein
MRYDEVEELPAGQFKRLAGVKRETFEQMLSVLKQSEQKKKRSVRPSKLSLADQLLLTLMYWREYRTQFHIARSYGIHIAAPLGAGLVTPMLKLMPIASSAKLKAPWPPRVSSSCPVNERYAPMKASRFRL